MWCKYAYAYFLLRRCTSGTWLCSHANYKCTSAVLVSASVLAIIGLIAFFKFIYLFDSMPSKRMEENPHLHHWDSFRDFQAASVTVLVCLRVIV